MAEIANPKPKTAEVPASGLSIACLATSLFLPILSAILGMVAIEQIKKSEGRLGGRGYAVSGIVINVLATILGCLIVLDMVLIVALPQYFQSRATAAIASPGQGPAPSAISQDRALGLIRLYISAQKSYLVSPMNETGGYARDLMQLFTLPNMEARQFSVAFLALMRSGQAASVPNSYAFAQITMRGGQAMDYTREHGFCAYPTAPANGRPTLIVDQTGRIWAANTRGAPVLDFPSNPAAEGWTGVR